MFNLFVCGSFHQQLEEDDPGGPSSASRRSRSISICRLYSKNNKNPYSTRGLDKFSCLLTELEERRQKIYAQMDSQDISFVRFVRSNSDDWVPIVVKLRDQKQDRVKPVGSKGKPKTQNSEAAMERFLEESSSPKKVQIQPQKRAKKEKSFSWTMELDRWGRPSYYLPIIIALILLCLVLFGRSVAILCTSLWWYLAPTIKGGDSNLKRSMKKKDYARRLSEKKIATDGLSSPKSKNMGVVKGSSSSSTPRKHRNGKS